MVADRPRGSGPATSRGVLARYTPDGAVGRLLLAVLAGPVSVLAFWFAIVAFAAPGPVSTVLGAFYAALTIGATVLALLLLWPVYCSLIGEVESTAAYETATAGGDATERSESDPVAVLKREYAAGELSEAEFERRLEAILGVEAVERARQGTRTAATGAASAELSSDGAATGRVPVEDRVRNRAEEG